MREIVLIFMAFVSGQVSMFAIMNGKLWGFSVPVVSAIIIGMLHDSLE